MINKILPIYKIAAKLGIPKKYIEFYGDYKAKISLDALKKFTPKRACSYVVVTGITPTHLGEGKTVTTLGLSMALNRLGKRSVASIREPSLGPFFGVKGGGVGGGSCRALPSDDISLHFTGDMHAVSAAHNLCASFIDNHLFRGNKIGIDPKTIVWRRVVDINDRSLRKVRIALGGGDSGFERDSGFEITAASEVMAVLALSQSLKDLRERLARTVVAFTKNGKPVTCEELKVSGAMTALLTDALKPNLVQTSEGTPCFVHTGPFANITHGNSSIVSDRLAMAFSDFVVTEAGFGADCGLEKFADIKCRTSGLRPNVAVLVTSVRALKIHSGRLRMVVGKPLGRDLERENPYAVEVGSANLEKQIENVRFFGIPCVVVVNRFKSDTDKEIDIIKRVAHENGAFECVVSDMFRCGSRGGEDLARAVINASHGRNNFDFLYPDDISIKSKIEVIAKKIYGAKSVHYEKEAEEHIKLYEKLQFTRLPVCMAKTHLSLSHDPSLKGRPRDFVLPVRDVRPSIGAGFLYALCGNVLTMPSLPSHPVGEHIDVDSKGNMVGLVGNKTGFH